MHRIPPLEEAVISLDTLMEKTGHKKSIGWSRSILENRKGTDK
jgi:hypothetical protein